MTNLLQEIEKILEAINKLQRLVNNGKRVQVIKSIIESKDKIINLEGAETLIMLRKLKIKKINRTKNKAMKS